MVSTRRREYKMKKLLKGCVLCVLVSVVLAACGNPSGSGTGPYSATVSDFTITGTVGDAISNTDVTITVSGTTFKAIAANTDVGSQSNIPGGLQAKVKTAVPDGATVMTIELSGTPATPLTGPLTLTLPAAFLNSGADLALTPNPNAKFAINSVSVYAALGSDETGYAAKILKNGEIHYTLPITSPDTENGITVLALSGSDVYAAGTGTGGGGKRGRIWKNGDLLFTPAGSNDTEFNAMAVSGSAVYAGGYEEVSSNNRRAAYWKQDGTKTTLSSTESEVTGLAAAGTDVYAAGVELNNSSIMVAKIWKNGSFLWDLSDGTTHAEPHRIMVVGNDVYTAGYKTTTAGKKIAVIWKNNSVLYSLTDGSYDAHAFALTVVGSDVYAAGVEENSSGTLIAKIWKNNTVLYTFSNGANDAEADAIAVVGSDVYAAGYVSDSGSGKVRGTIWKNNSVVYTAPVSQYDTWISSIVVVE
jgi:hypothetical protein